MWQCPKCGRTFTKENQRHACGTTPQTVDDYIAAQAAEVQPWLNQVRAAIKSAVPDVEERI